MQTNDAGARPVEQQVRPLAQQLRDCANGKPDPFNPHWVDGAQRLMRWAADALDAADAALLDNYRSQRPNVGVEPPERSARTTG